MTFMDGLRALIGLRHVHRRACDLPCCADPPGDDSSVADAVHRNAQQAQDLRDLSRRSVHASGGAARAIAKVAKRLEAKK